MKVYAFKKNNEEVSRFSDRFCTKAFAYGYIRGCISHKETFKFTDGDMFPATSEKTGAVYTIEEIEE